MALFNSTCPDCDGPLERRKFVEGWAPEGKEYETMQDWWCPACKYRWISLYGDPLEAEA